MTRYDVIVIGGGIAGISAAAELAQDMSVCVLEAEPQTGYHATGRSAAMFIRNYGNATLRALSAVAAPVFHNPGDLADSPILSPRGEMLVASHAELDALAAYTDGATGLETLTPDQAVELVPILRRDSVAAAVVEWDAQDIDVDLLLSGYLRRLRRAGGTVVTDARVTGLRRAGDLWQLTAGATTYSAPRVVNAAGAWARDVGRLAGATAVPLQPLRRSVALILAPDGYDTTRWPLFAGASEGWYAKPDAGRLLVSPADEDPVEPHDAWPDDMVLAEGLHRYEQAVTTPVRRVERSWAGLRTFAADRTPVVGFDPHAAGFFWLAGQGGYGIQTAPALSRLTADLICERETGLASAITGALSPARFTG